MLINQYISSRVRVNGLDIAVNSQLPYRGNLQIDVNGSGRLKLRIPAWFSRFTCKVNGKQLTAAPLDGCIALDVSDKTVIKLNLRVTVPAKRLRTAKGLYSYMPLQMEEKSVTLIPYFTWVNRGETVILVCFL